MTEADEIAAAMPLLAHDTTSDQARALVRAQMPDETPVVIDNVVEALMRRSRVARISGWCQVATRTGIDWWEYKIKSGGRTYSVTLEPRPAYCDRGHWIGKCHGVSDLDAADSFPRYFMDCERAKAELADWLKWRVERRHA